MATIRLIFAFVGLTILLAVIVGAIARPPSYSHPLY
jgi:hypothetical protein